MRNFLKYAAAASAVACGLGWAVASSAADAEAGGAPDAQLQKLMDSFSASRDVNTQKGGAAIYATVCAGCHMPEGQGATGDGFYPKLADNQRLAAGAYPMTVVIPGLHGMPSFANRLDDEQVAAVVNYIRTHFGNDYSDAIAPAQVAELRKQAAPDPHSSYD